MQWIEEGVHLTAGDEVYISWGRRLLYCPGLMYARNQRLLLQLLADYPDEQSLPALVEDLGGVKAVFMRFFQHYNVSESMLSMVNCFAITLLAYTGTE